MSERDNLYPDRHPMVELTIRCSADSAVLIAALIQAIEGDFDSIDSCTTVLPNAIQYLRFRCEHSDIEEWRIIDEWREWMHKFIDLGDP